MIANNDYIISSGEFKTNRNIIPLWYHHFSIEAFDRNSQWKLVMILGASLYIFVRTCTAPRERWIKIVPISVVFFLSFSESDDSFKYTYKKVFFWAMKYFQIISVPFFIFLNVSRLFGDILKYSHKLQRYFKLTFSK